MGRGLMERNERAGGRTGCEVSLARRREREGGGREGGRKEILLVLVLVLRAETYGIEQNRTDTRETCDDDDDDDDASGTDSYDGWISIYLS